jgi:cytochrome P450
VRRSGATVMFHSLGLPSALHTMQESQLLLGPTRAKLRMARTPKQIPPGPIEKYDTGQDLLTWMGERFAQFGDIYRASIYGRETYVISAPEHVEHVLLRNWQNYPKGQAIKRIALLLGNGLMVSTGELWMRQRRMMQPAFTRAAIASLNGVIVTANARLLENWTQAAKANATVNVTRDVSLVILEIVLRAIFGDDYEDVAPQFRVVSDEAARNLEFALMLRSLSNVTLDVAEKRRQERRLGHDFLGMLMQARDRDTDQAMSDPQLIKEVLTLIVAGHETTASTLNWTWYLLSQNPMVEKKLSEELSGWRGDQAFTIDDLRGYPYSRQVIEEALRLYPPGWLMTRRAVRDDQMGEFFVPAGTEVYVSPFYIQRDPRLWETPEAFNPNRFDAMGADRQPSMVMIPFSAGPRNCIGEHLARMEMQIHLMMIAKRLRLRYLLSGAPALAAGVNLLSANDFVMTPELKPTKDLSA